MFLWGPMSASNATHDFLGPDVLVCGGEVVKGERNRKQTRRHIGKSGREKGNVFM